MEGALKIVNGNIILSGTDEQVIKTYYSEGDAIRTEWLDQESEKILVWTEKKNIKIINKEGQLELMV